MKTSIIIIPASRLGYENGWLRQYQGVIGDAITVPLSADGSEPPTHYGCNWEAMEETDYDKVYSHFNNKNACRVINGDRYTFEEACASVGLVRVQSEMPI